MAFSKKTWKDRVSEQPQRRLLTPTDGGTSYTVDVTRQEGIVVEEGDAFSATNMNDLETRIKNTFDSDESTLNTVNTKANTNASNISTLQTNVNNLSSQKAPNNHASTTQTYGVGSTSAFGHLKINDSYTSSSGSASQGVAASSKAIYDAYTNLNGKINTANSNISGLSNRMGTAEGNINSLSNRTSTIENELTANNNRIYMDYKDGKYGYNTDPNRGAGSFVPFKNKADMIACLPKDMRATCSHGADFAYGASSFTVTVNFSGNVSISGSGSIYKNNVSVGQSTSFVEGDVLAFNLLVSVQTGGEGTISSTITWS